jgi:transcriptional regulator with XRE-family HTH domain
VEQECAVGALIRDLRLAVGWSQGRLAAELCRISGSGTVTRNEVSRWERGTRMPRWWLPHLATALQVPLTLLEDAERMERRVFLTDVAASVIAPLVASDLLAKGFAAALDGQPSVTTWRGRVDAYGRDYMSQGSAQIQQRLAGDLVVLQQQVEDLRLWAVTARLMTLFGKTFPGSDGAKAASWYRMAAVAADRSGDLDTRVWVRGRAAIALGYEGASLPLAEVFAAQALALDVRPSLGRLNALMGQAHARAVRGDRAGALELLTEGRRVFEIVASPDDAVSDYGVPWWRMNVFTSLLAARLGDERLAVEAQDAAAAALPPSLPRFATHLEMHKGLMLVRAGDRAGGTALARAALDALPAEKHSLTLRMLMEEIQAAAS